LFDFFSIACDAVHEVINYLVVVEIPVADSVHHVFHIKQVGFVPAGFVCHHGITQRLIPVFSCLGEVEFCYIVALKVVCFEFFVEEVDVFFHVHVAIVNVGLREELAYLHHEKVLVVEVLVLVGYGCQCLDRVVVGHYIGKLEKEDVSANRVHILIEPLIEESKVVLFGADFVSEGFEPKITAICPKAYTNHKYPQNNFAFHATISSVDISPLSIGIFGEIITLV